MAGRSSSPQPSAVWQPRIEVDGGINTETASLCAQAGASVLVMGSAFFKAQDRAALAKQVRAL